MDVIISVGYRVKSKNGVIFRKWANTVLKDYLIKGYAVNNKRLEYLEKTVKLVEIASRIDTELKGSEAKEIIKVINSYSNALNLLDDYDHKTLIKPKGTANNKIIYEECINIIDKLKFNNDSNLFALERDEGLKAIIGAIYQTFDGEELYPTVEEKSANLLYLITKNYVFIDGNDYLEQKVTYLQKNAIYEYVFCVIVRIFCYNIFIKLIKLGGEILCKLYK